MVSSPAIAAAIAAAHAANRRNLRNHSSKPSNFKCNQCDRKFEYQSDLKAHLKAHQDQKARDKIESNTGDGCKIL